jgi:hypothetical protein
MAGLVPAISIQEGAALLLVGITGTRPVMTRAEALSPLSRSPFLPKTIAFAPGHC